MQGLRHDSSLVCCCIFFTSFAGADPQIVSREYKMMLDAAKFSYSSEYDDVQELIDLVKPSIEQALNRNVTGSLQLAEQRMVRFYDVAGRCDLNRAGYSFRERIDNNLSEITLKFRSPDRYIAYFEDVSSLTSGAETKLEADIGKGTENPVKIIYGHSTKVPNTRTINKVDDIHAHFPGFKNNYSLDDNLSLSLVGNLIIRERVYNNVFIDLGQFDAEISVSLWYANPLSHTDVPLIAELSFKYKDSSANDTRKVVNRALEAFSAIQGLTSWADSAALTKTRFVYQYDSSFCN